MTLFAITYTNQATKRRRSVGFVSATTPEDALAIIRAKNPGYPPASFTAKKDFGYSPWRHGGWYTNVRHPSGACGCVSRNYDDGKWRIVCDPRPFEARPTFKTRDEAAQAEADLIEARPDLYRRPAA